MGTTMVAGRGQRSCDPIMIKNGRRIDQKTTMAQQEGPTGLLTTLDLMVSTPCFDGEIRQPSLGHLRDGVQLEAAAEAIRSREGGTRYLCLMELR